MVRSKEYRMSIDFHPCFVPFSLSLSYIRCIDCPITGRENISRSFGLGWVGKFLEHGFLCGNRARFANCEYRERRNCWIFKRL